MTHPHTCPVCKGRGTTLDRYETPEACHVCNGHGIVWEPVDQRESAEPAPSPMEINGL